MAGKYLPSLTKDEIKKFLDSVDVILSDCDGVLWRENDVISGSPETVRKFRELGKKFFYVTNNSGKTRQQCAEKCRGFNYDATLDDIVCSSYLAAMYLKDCQCKKKAYIVGSQAIAKELEAAGIPSFGSEPDCMKGDVLDLISTFKPEADVGAVVVGFDEHFSYPKLVKSSTYLQDPSVLFVGTNMDFERPSPTSTRYPGAGCFVKAVEAAAGRTAVMVGKPAPYLKEFVTKKYGVDPARTLMVGDNPNTDILFGKLCGFRTLLVLSGITKKSDVEAAKNSLERQNIVPDYYTDQLSDVSRLIG